MRALFFLVLLASCCAWSKDQLPPITIPNSEVRTFKSHFNGADYTLSIVLPVDYDTSTERYPVLFLLDGSYSTILASVALHRLAIDGFPKLILVGEDSARSRYIDYVPTPTNQAVWGKLGKGADAATFLRVLREELVPLIDKTYRTDPAQRGLYGHSAAGLFATYVLFHDAGLTFKRLWISSPALYFDGGVSLKDEADFAITHDDLPVRVFTSIGDLEGDAMSDPWNALTKNILSRNYEHLSWTAVVLPGHPHSTVPLGAIGSALYWLYGRPSVTLDPARLLQVAGRYRLADGRIWTLTPNGSRLSISGYKGEASMPGVPLEAESATVFYSRTYKVEVEVPVGEPQRPDKIKITGERFPQGSVAQRIP
jgi:uncharacterized protein